MRSRPTLLQGELCGEMRLPCAGVRRGRRWRRRDQGKNSQKTGEIARLHLCPNFTQSRERTGCRSGEGRVPPDREVACQRSGGRAARRRAVDPLRRDQTSHLAESALHSGPSLD